MKHFKTKNYWYARKTQNSDNEYVTREYNAARNIVTKTSRKKKQEYYENKFNKPIGDNKKVWETIKQVMYKRRKKNPISTIKDKKPFINELNQFIALIGKTTSRKNLN